MNGIKCWRWLTANVQLQTSVFPPGKVSVWVWVLVYSVFLCSCIFEMLQILFGFLFSRPLSSYIFVFSHYFLSASASMTFLICFLLFSLVKFCFLLMANFIPCLLAPSVFTPCFPLFQFQLFISYLCFSLLGCFDFSRFFSCFEWPVSAASQVSFFYSFANE